MAILAVSRSKVSLSLGDPSAALGMTQSGYWVHRVVFSETEPRQKLLDLEDDYRNVVIPDVARVAGGGDGVRKGLSSQAQQGIRIQRHQPGGGGVGGEYEGLSPAPPAARFQERAHRACGDAGDQAGGVVEAVRALDGPGGARPVRRKVEEAAVTDGKRVPATIRRKREP